MVELIGNLVFLSGKALILLFLLYVWYWLFFIEKDYVVFAMLTAAMILGGYFGMRAAKAEMGA